MEFLQLLVSMRPDDKDIIEVPVPHLWFPGGSLQGPCLKVFHEDVGHKWREGRPHCCFFYLFIEVLAKLEIGGLQAKSHQVEEVGDVHVGSLLERGIIL